MNLNYYNVPVSSHDPSDDQTLMLTNTVSINAILGVDHIPFNTDNGGRHLKAQLQDRLTIPTGLSAGFSTLYSKVVGSPSQAELFFTRGVTGQEVQLTGNSSLVNDGYSVLPGGLILQWGRFVRGSSWPSGAQSLTFPTPFPNTCFMVNTTFSGSSSSDKDIGITSLSVGSFSWVYSGSSDSSYTGFYWFSIGR